MCLVVKSLSQRETFFSETSQGDSKHMFFVMVARKVATARSSVLCLPVKPIRGDGATLAQ